jgi:vacuolar-type H+-ATPase subunit E/Vma4
MGKFNLAAVRTQDGQKDQIDPRDIFKTLPLKSRKYSYLRDVQAEVLDYWSQHQDESEIVIKMNTGSGKTVVSLLILASYMKQAKGPCVYVVPDNYLLDQVQNEAKEMGIEVVTEPSTRFLKQESILVVNINKLFNGKSIFGVDQEGAKIDVGVFLIDDAHACIDKIDDQFTIKISRENAKYNALINIFKHDLNNQSETIFSDIEEAYPNGGSIQVPFWAIKNHFSDIISILSDQGDSETKWKYPLIKSYLKFSDCIVSPRIIEFSIRVIPTNIIRAYEKAKKIIVSATLPDDTILCKSLGISKKAIENIITPKSAGDLGERLIIVPNDINSSFLKDDIKAMIEDYSKNMKVFVIVPSNKKSEYWKDIAKIVLTSDNLNEELKKFKKSTSGLAILVNRYDGIDLPDDDCRILILDDLPEDRAEIEKIDNSSLDNSTNVVVRKIRKIEQGMGRAIRSNEDYCVVMLLGSGLTNYLYAKNGMQYFTPATRKQIDISSNLLSQIRDGSLEDLKEAINLVLSRDGEWIKTIKSALLGLEFSAQIPNDLSFILRESFELAWNNQIEKAIHVLENFANTLNIQNEKQLSGWIKYYIAAFTNNLNELKAQEIMKSASNLNSRLVRPLDGIQYQKMLESRNDQVKKCIEYFNRVNDNNKLIVLLNSVLERLVFRPETADQFEDAIFNLALYLGFDSQRPEKDYKRGPDNLWGCGNLQFFIIECKNGCTTDTINKHDTNQMNGSIEWFENVYDSTCKKTPILIHPSTRFDHAATPNKEVRLMTEKKLNLFKNAVKTFVSECMNDGKINDTGIIKASLVKNKLEYNSIIDNYTLPVKIKK